MYGGPNAAGSVAGYGGHREMDKILAAWDIFVPCFFGVSVAVAEMYVFERKIPFLGVTPGRAATWKQLLGAFLGNLVCAVPMAHYAFAASGGRQYFMAAMATIETFGGRNSRKRRRRSPGAPDPGVAPTRD